MVVGGPTALAERTRLESRLRERNRWAPVVVPDGVEDVVARPRADFAEAGEVDALHGRAGGDEAGARGESAESAVGQADLEGVRVGERGTTAHELEAPAFQLPAPVVRKLADEAPLPRADRAGIRAEEFRAQAKLPGVPNRFGAVGAFEQRFARHAAAQDAEPADFRAALHDGYAQAESGGGGGGGVARAAAADDEEIEGVGHGVGTVSAPAWTCQIW